MDIYYLTKRHDNILNYAIRYIILYLNINCLILTVNRVVYNKLLLVFAAGVGVYHKVQTYILGKKQSNYEHVGISKKIIPVLLTLKCRFSLETNKQPKFIKY